MKKIKIAHLLYVVGPAGKEKGVLRIASKMDRSLFDIDIIALYGVRQREVIDLHKINLIDLGASPGNGLKLVPALTAILKKNKYDIIYTHSWNTLIEGYLSAVFAGVPIKIHGEHGTFERSRLKDAVQKRFWSKFDMLTVVAADLEKKIKKQFAYQKKNIRIIYNGTDTEIFKPDITLANKFRKKFRLENFFLVGTVGRFYPVKDHPTLIKGFKKFKEQRSDAKLVLVGGGGETGKKNQQSYERLVKDLGLEEDVVFIPPILNPEEAMNAFDVFVLSSISEGCSNVILEALACGTPVVATNTGGNPELISHLKTGLLFDVGDVNDLAKNLTLLFDNQELRKELSRAGMAEIQERFSLQKSVSDYEKMFQELYTRYTKKIDSTPVRKTGLNLVNH